MGERPVNLPVSTDTAPVLVNVPEVAKAQKDGFTCFPDFPDINKEYTENVLEIIGKRLINSERSDIQKYYDFWEINPAYKDDKYYLLAHTQGMLATDNFEFLADYYPIKGLSFISEICGLSHTEIPTNFIQIGEELNWKFDRKNQFDTNAINVLKENTRLGNVKLIHCNVFHKIGGDKLKIKVKSIEQNGHLARVFIQIAF
ncbi:hypothetical protein FACS18945_5750 [Bacteroidia bacterium]|nr:hypothetical protein FACS18945_5750 [Bacteroidia bacterium]